MLTRLWELEDVIDDAVVKPARVLVFVHPRLTPSVNVLRWCKSPLQRQVEASEWQCFLQSHGFEEKNV